MLIGGDFAVLGQQPDHAGLCLWPGFRSKNAETGSAQQGQQAQQGCPVTVMRILARSSHVVIPFRDGDERVS